MNYLILEKNQENKVILNPTIEDTIVYYQNEIKNMEEQLKSIKGVILKEFKELGYKSIEAEKVIITIKDAYTKETFDTKKFKEEHENLYNDYVKMSNVSESVMIKCKNGK